MKVILDTNFLIDLARFRIDLEEVKIGDLVTVDAVVKELEKIAEKKTRSSRYAKVALKLVDENMKIVQTKFKTADKAILSLADKDTVIATNDSELRKTLKKLGVKAIYLKSKKHLAILM